MTRIYSIACGLGIGFLIETPGGLFLIDTGSPGQEQQVLRKMKELGRYDLKVIWITHAHYDHYGSAAALRKATGAPVGVHPADADAMSRGKSPLGTTRSYGFIYPIFLPLVNRIRPLPPTQPDFTLDEGETLEPYGLNATILYTPGHTPGHTCVLLEGGTAFAADLIGGFPRPKMQRLLATDWRQLPGSLEHLREARPEWVYTGHVRKALPGGLL